MIKKLIDTSNAFKLFLTAMSVGIAFTSFLLTWWWSPMKADVIDAKKKNVLQDLAITQNSSDIIHQRELVDKDIKAVKDQISGFESRVNTSFDKMENKIEKNKDEIVEILKDHQGGGQ
jgi:hypothetical protein